jgi:hypothetical protein
MRLTLSFVVLLGCGTDQPQDWVKGFDPPPAPDGYTRFVTPTVKGIQPGDNLEYCQWVAPAADTAQDILDVTGHQSATGHHAVLYGTTETNFKVGESHLCTADDMVSISFLGGIGGEGSMGSATQLPEGLNFRLPAGQALMANTHWLNATDGVVDGQAVIDLKVAPVSDQRVPADMFVNNADTFSIGPNAASSWDSSCVLKQDLSIAMLTNHMHNYGMSVYSELLHTDGTKEMLRNDTTWSAEWQFNPQYTRYTVNAPQLFHAGDTIHTHCEWQNTTNKTLGFPDEMCVTIGFYFPGRGMIVCENGSE